MPVKVEVYERTHRLPDDPEKYQADILGRGFDHHGIGRTPSEALLNAAVHWRQHDEMVEDEQRREIEAEERRELEREAMEDHYGRHPHG